MTAKNRWIIAASLYAAAGCVAFGHSAAARQKIADTKYRQCEIERVAGKVPFCLHGDELVPMVGLIAGAFWPLYLSWVAFEDTNHDR